MWCVWMFERRVRPCEFERHVVLERHIGLERHVGLELGRGIPFPVAGVLALGRFGRRGGLWRLWWLRFRREPAALLPHLVGYGCGLVSIRNLRFDPASQTLDRVLKRIMNVSDRLSLACLADAGKITCRTKIGQRARRLSTAMRRGCR